MPWDQPLARWSGPDLEFVDLPVGASRHTVRFAVVDGSIIALKELPLEVGQQEYEVLRELEARGAPVGQGLRPGHAHRRSSRHHPDPLPGSRSFQFRRLFMRLPEGASRYRDQLLDSMTGLLVELHRMGMFWGDCSLANTLLMRDGQRLQAYLVDGETSELHEQLSDGQREADIEIAIENVAGDLADMAVMNGKSMEEMDDDFDAALSLRDRYEKLWERAPQGRHASGPTSATAWTGGCTTSTSWATSSTRSSSSPATTARGTCSLRVAVAGRDYHSRRLRQLTGIEAGEGQSAILLNDVTAWAGMGWAGDWDSKEGESGRTLTRRDGARWTLEIFEPAVGQLIEVMGDDIDPVQAYCDLLEVRWLLSEQAGHDVGNQLAIRSIAQKETPVGSSAEMVVVETPSTPRRLGWNRP